MFSGARGVPGGDESGASRSLPSLLECVLDPNSMDVLLSYLTLADYARLSVASGRMGKLVSASSHLRVAEGECGFFRGQRGNGPPPAALPRPVLQRLLEGFPNLGVLDLEGVEAGDCGSGGLLEILNACPAAGGLRSVRLEGCAIGSGRLRLKNLTDLVLSGSPGGHGLLASLREGSPRLRSLVCEHSPALRDADLAGLCGSTALEELGLGHCDGLSEPVGFFPSLARASLAGGLSLRSLSGFVCPGLRVLDLSFCVRLSDTEIERLVEESPLLERLVLEECLGVHTLDLSSGSLRHLDAGFAHNLSRLRLVCPALRVLNTTCCSSLKSVSLEDARSLPSLDLGGLVQLRELSVTGATKLARLDLRNCRRLDRCRIDGPALRHIDAGGCRRAGIAPCATVQKVLQQQKRCETTPAVAACW